MNIFFRKAILQTKYCIIPTFVFLLYFDAYGQPEQMMRHLKQVSMENGLPQNSINYIVKDKLGYYWFSTQKGLCRYDGNRVDVFNMKDIDAGLSNRVTFLGCNSDGSLMIEAERRAEPVYYELLPSCHFLPIKSDSVNISHLTQYPVPITCQISTTLNVTTRDWVCGGFGSENTFNTGYFLLTNSSAKGIYYYDIKKKIFTKIDSGWVYSRTNAFVIDSSIYLFNDDGVLSGWRGMKKIKTIPGTLQSLLHADIHKYKPGHCISQNKGSLILLLGQKLYFIYASGDSINARLICKDSKIDNVSCHFYDTTNKTLLIGTVNDGLHVYRTAGFSTAGYAAGNRLAQTVYYEVACVNNHMLLTNAGLLHLDDPRRSHLPNGISNLSNWCAKTDEGHVLRISPASHLLDFDSNMRLVDSVPSLSVIWKRLPWTTGQGKFYLQDIQKLYIFNTKNKLNLTDSLTVLSSSVVTLLLFHEYILFGGSSGVTAYNQRTHQFQELTALRGIQVRSLTKDSYDHIWIGTYGAGWYKYNMASSKLIQMPEDANHFLAYVHALEEDGLGYMWLSTNNGLFRFSCADLDRCTGKNEPLFFNYFNKESGFFTDEFNGGEQKCSAKFPNGNLCFSSMKDVVIITPRAIPIDTIAGKILFDDLRINKKQQDNPGKVNLQPDFEDMEIRVSVPYIGNRYALNLEYSISSSSYAESWYPVPENGRILITRLQHGNYQLKVRTLHRFGSNDYMQASLSFSVLPFWYETYTFYGIILLLLFLMVATLFRLRLLVLQRQKRQLEQLVKERTESLERSEENVRRDADIRLKITSIVIHDIKSPLVYMGAILDDAAQQIVNGQTQTYLKTFNSIRKNIESVSWYAQNLLVWIYTQQGSLSELHKNRVQLNNLITDIADTFKILIEGTTKTLQIQLPGELIFIDINEDMLRIIIRNLLDNAMKYTDHGHITLSMQYLPDGICICVTDTGRGMTQDEIDKILDNTALARERVHAGLGYKIIKDMVNAIGAYLSIESTREVGTKVSILLSQPAKIISPDETDH